MKRHGFAKLYEVIREYDAELYEQLPRAKDVVGPCALCNQLLSKPALNRGINEVFARYERDKLASVFAYLSERVGAERMEAMVGSLIEQDA